MRVAEADPKAAVAEEAVEGCWIAVDGAMRPVIFL